MNDGYYFQLEVVFERDMNKVTLPLLGQLGFMGGLKALVGSEEILPFLNVIPDQEIAGRMVRNLHNGSVEKALETIPAPHPQKWFPSAEGWKAASRIKTALRNPASVERAGMESFKAEVEAETDILMRYLQVADDDNIRFRLSFEDCVDPTEAQKRWVALEFSELAEIAKKVLSEAGVDVNEETES